tara:strand:+ start:1395 stop:3050 length:1656 start_codon:yes stop_codon:yes gene_type:complete
MTVGIIQFYDNKIDYGVYSEKINSKYCELNNYFYFCETDSNKISLSLDGKAPTWYKPKLILDVFSQHPNLDYLLFLDADAIVSDFNQKIEDFIDAKYDLILAEDIGHHSDMNAGVILIKNTQWSKDFLEQWWKSGEEFTGNDSKELNIHTLLPQHMEQKGTFENALWHDQTCLTLLYRNNKDVRDHIKIIPNHSFNWYEPNQGNFIFHAYSKGHSPYRTLDILYREKFETSDNLDNINLIVYHVFCTGNYLDVVSKQIDRLKSSGLYEWCDKLEVTCINLEGNFNSIKNIFKELDKVTLNTYTSNDYEYEGINKVWEYSQTHSGKVLYFHSKGVSNQYKNKSTQEHSEWKAKGVEFWKELMEYYLIDNFKECINKLDTYDQCGLTLNNQWWWGNFWWSNLSWVKSNPKPSKGDRWYFEAWLNHGRNPKGYEFYHFSWNAYYTYLPLDFVVNPKISYKVNIKKAYYGSIGEQQDEGRPVVDRVVADVTNTIIGNFKSNQEKAINIRVDNNIVSEDPHFGFEKYLEIHFDLDGEECILTTSEGQHCKIIFVYE